MRCSPRPSLLVTRPFRRTRRRNMEPRASGSSSRPPRTSYEPTLVDHGRKGDVERGPAAVEASPFSLVTWLKLHGVDIFTLAVIGMLCLVVHTRGAYSSYGIKFHRTQTLLDPAPNRVFPIFNLDGSLVYPELAYPRKKQIIPVWASAIMAIFIPTLFFALFQIRRRSLDDFLTSFMGILKSTSPQPRLNFVL